jgi:hypothetical protein
VHSDEGCIISRRYRALRAAVSMSVCALHIQSEDMCMCDNEFRHLIHKRVPYMLSCDGCILIVCTASAPDPPCKDSSNISTIHSRVSSAPLSTPPPHIQINTHTHTHTHTHSLTHTHTHTHTTHTRILCYIHTYLHTYIYTHTHIHTRKHTHIHTYLPTYLPTYLHTYIRIYIHIYMHACICMCVCERERECVCV